MNLSYIHSQLNSLFLKCRQRVHFQRKGYKESLNQALNEEDQKWLDLFNIENYESLSYYSIQKNIQTLRWLNDFDSYIPNFRAQTKSIIDAGCQDFRRLPALAAFFKHPKTHITGIEIDGYPLLHDWHSRFDRAQYFISLTKKAARYLCTDFFYHHQPSDFIICAYPFLTVAPTLQWGLPQRFASPQFWIESLCKNLKPEAFTLVIHHGETEQSIFDSHRSKYHLKLIFRKTYPNSLLPDGPAECVSLYQHKK